MFASSKIKVTRSLLIALLLFTSPVYAQGFSYDGNRWYEIEVSIFSNRPLSTQDEERYFPEKIALAYPEELIRLKPSTASYSFDFPESLLTASDDPLNTLIELPNSLVTIGPEFTPASGAFTVLNFTSDSFISLGPEQQQFKNINQDIEGSSEHRLLYHATWRQPVLNKIQSSALFIEGGEQFGIHSELEGSITISYNINRVDIDTQLWLNSFKDGNEQSLWEVPEQAFTRAEVDEGSSTNTQTYFIDNVAVMNETRQMRSNEFHYLDHPEFGLLIQIRPYELPDIFGFDNE